MAIISTIQIDTRSASKSIADLEKELQETNEQLKNVDINSDAFQQLQKKAADAKGQLDRINQTTDAISKGFQGFGENLAKVTGSISGGITAATAAMQLLGVENENVVAGIAKLQQLMAFTQGISSLKDLGSGLKGVSAAVKAATKSFHGLKGAIVATGIGALVVALGLVIENWEKIVAWMNKFVDVSEISKKAIAGLSAAWEGLKQTIVALGNTITTSIVTPFKTVTNAIKAFSETEGSLLDKLKAATAASKDTIVKSGEGVISAYKEIGAKASDAFHESLIEQEKKNAEARARASIEAYLKAYETQQQRLADSALLQDLVESGRGRGAQKTQVEAPEAPDVEEEVEEDDGWADKVTAAQNYYNSLIELELGADAEFDAIQDEKRQKLEEFYQQGLISAEQYNKSVAALDKKEKLHKVQMYSQAATGIADILDSLASTMDQSNEKQFKAMKAMQIASATIQMMVGITTALSGAFTTKSGPWDIALAVIQAASIATAGGIQIANIAKQKYDSSSSSSSTATASLSSAASSITTPEQYSSAVEGVNLEESVTDTRVYVLESDIQNTTNRVSVQEAENRY